MSIYIRISILSAKGRIFNEHAPICNNTLKLNEFQDQIFNVPDTLLKIKLANLTQGDYPEHAESIHLHFPPKIIPKRKF